MILTVVAERLTTLQLHLKKQFPRLGAGRRSWIYWRLRRSHLCTLLWADSVLSRCWFGRFVAQHRHRSEALIWLEQLRHRREALIWLEQLECCRHLGVRNGALNDAAPCVLTGRWFILIWHKGRSSGRPRRLSWSDGLQPRLAPRACPSRPLFSPAAASAPAVGRGGGRGGRLALTGGPARILVGPLPMR
jgi:hypothetical protein